MRVRSHRIAGEGLLNKEQVKERVSQIMGDDRKVRWCYELFQSMYPYSARKDEVENDLEQGQNLDRLPLDQIKVPALIIHGDADVDISHGRYAAESIKRAEHIWVESGMHLCFWVSDEAYEVQRKAFEFIRGHL